MFALVLGTLLAQATPSPTPTPPPAYSLDAAFTEYTSGSHATALTDLSNALLTLTKNTGTIRGAATVGAYALPVVGFALSSTTQPGTNTELYSVLPIAYLSYVPNVHVTLSTGKLPSLFGQENAFTTQNVNIQRGLLWNAETTVDRGVRVAYANGKVSATLGYDDGFYAGNTGRAVEALVGYAFDSTTSIQLAAIVPGRATPPNATASVANKRELDVMFSRTMGRLTLSPYILAVTSPSSPALGYTSAENALGAALIAQYAIAPLYSCGFRFETFANHSAVGDTSTNADLVGFGPGSRATTWTVTPAYRSNLFLARVEYSRVYANDAAAQSRLLFEAGVVF